MKVGIDCIQPSDDIVLRQDQVGLLDNYNYFNLKYIQSILILGNYQLSF